MKSSIQIFAFIILCILISTSTFAQEARTDSSAKVYDLNDFKFRYQRYRALEFDYNFQGQLNSTNIKAERNSLFKQNASSYDFSLLLRGFTFQNTQKKQVEESFNAGISATGASANGLDVDTQSNNFTPSANYNCAVRNYNGNRFFTFEYGGNGNFSNIREDNSKASLHRLAINASIGLGIGRIENVSDAVTAQFLLKDLQRNGGLETYNATQLENLADGIVKARNARYIGDNRFRFIDQITLLDSVARANNLVGNNELKYFTVLYDNFLYTNYFRETGTRHTFSLTNSFITEDNAVGNANSFYFLGPEYEFVNAFQKSAYLERKTTVGASFGNVWSLNGEENSQRSQGLNTRATVRHGYIYQPNSRTFFDFSANTGINIVRYVQDLNFATLSGGLTADVNYFFSRRLSIFGSLNYTVNRSKLTLRDSGNSNVTIFNNFSTTSGLTYAFY